MSNVSLKKDFADGNKLYASQLNNNFSAIEAALGTANGINWQDDTTHQLIFFKGDTDEVTDRAITEGQLVYDYEKQTMYLDHNSSRTEMISGSIATSIVNTLTGDETGKAPSVHAVNEGLTSAIASAKSGVLSDTEAASETTKAYTCNYVNGKVSDLNDAINLKYSTSRITSGTSEPSGGDNGDIYFKYSA